MIFELGSRSLEKGMTGTDVVELQDLLKNKGYTIKVDGEFGSTTEEAIKDFQKKNNIDVTGKANVVTIYYLKKK